MTAAAIYEDANQRLFHAPQSGTVFLDLETTGLNPKEDRIVEIAIVDESGLVLVDSLINPKVKIPPSASAIHGITDAMVGNAPTFAELWPIVRSAIEGKRVVIYNAAFDRSFLPGRLSCASSVECAMLAFSKYRGIADGYGRGRKWFKLTAAAEYVEHVWTGDAHRALSDAEACRSVWLWLMRNEGSPPAPGVTASSETSSKAASLLERSRAALRRFFH